MGLEMRQIRHPFGQSEATEFLLFSFQCRRLRDLQALACSLCNLDGEAPIPYEINCTPPENPLWQCPSHTPSWQIHPCSFGFVFLEEKAFISSNVGVQFELIEAPKNRTLMVGWIKLPHSILKLFGVSKQIFQYKLAKL